MQCRKEEHMNKRQKKKRFKRRFGFNPPRNMSIQTATRIMENRETIMINFERLKKAIYDLWERIRQPLFELAEELQKIKIALIDTQEKQREQRKAIESFQEKVLLQQSQQEREEKQFEGDINILNHDRRQDSRTNENI
jgi:predicted glycosyltransferase